MPLRAAPRLCCAGPPLALSSWTAPPRAAVPLPPRAGRAVTPRVPFRDASDLSQRCGDVPGPGGCGPQSRAPLWDGRCVECGFARCRAARGRQAVTASGGCEE